MATNTLSKTITYNPLLSREGQAWYGNATEFAALKVAPVAPQTTKEGTYIIWDKANMRADDDTRALGAEGKETTSGVSSTTFSMTWHSKKHKILWEQDGYFPNKLDWQRRATRVVRENLLRRREIEIATVATTSASYGSNTAAASTAWDTSSTTMKTDIMAAKTAIWESSGKIANKIVIPIDVQMEMALQPPFSTAGTSYDKALLTPAGIPSTIYGLDVITVGTLYDSNALGSSSTSYQKIWSDYVIVMYQNENWLSGDTSLLTTFTYNGPDYNGMDLSVSTWEDPAIRCTWVEAREYRDVVLTDATCGYLISSVLT